MQFIDYLTSVSESVYQHPSKYQRSQPEVGVLVYIFLHFLWKYAVDVCVILNQLRTILCI
jgi:hypothetical protein